MNPTPTQSLFEIVWPMAELQDLAEWLESGPTPEDYAFDSQDEEFLRGMRISL